MGMLEIASAAHETPLAEIDLSFVVIAQLEPRRANWLKRAAVPKKYPGPPRAAPTPGSSNFEHSHYFRACVSQEIGSIGNALRSCPFLPPVSAQPFGHCAQRMAYTSARRCRQRMETIYSPNSRCARRALLAARRRQRHDGAARGGCCCLLDSLGSSAPRRRDLFPGRSRSMCP
jgi:hypothetical protein